MKRVDLVPAHLPYAFHLWNVLLVSFIKRIVWSARASVVVETLRRLDVGFVKRNIKKKIYIFFLKTFKQERHTSNAIN